MNEFGLEIRKRLSLSSSASYKKPSSGGWTASFLAPLVVVVNFNFNFLRTLHTNSIILFTLNCLGTSSYTTVNYVTGHFKSL